MTASPTPAELTALRVANAAVRNSSSPNSHIIDTAIFALGAAGLLQSPEIAASRPSPWQQAVDGLNALVDADIPFHIEPDGHFSGPFGDEHIEWDHDAARWRLVEDDDDKTAPALSGSLLGRLGDPGVGEAPFARIMHDAVPAGCCGHTVLAHRPGGCIAATVRTRLIVLCGCLAESASPTKDGA